jgi:hypothetical protein
MPEIAHFLIPSPSFAEPNPRTLLYAEQLRNMIGSAFWDFTRKVRLFFTAAWILSTGTGQYRSGRGHVSTHQGRT